MLFQLSSFSGWVFRCRQCARSPGKGHMNGKLPTSCSERRRVRRRGRRERSSSKLRQKLCAASSRASGKPAEILPGKVERSMGKRKGKKGTCCSPARGSDLLCACNFAVWCCGNQGDAKGSMSLANSWQKIR